MSEEVESIDTIVGRAFNILEGREQYDLRAYLTSNEAAEGHFTKALDMDPNCYAALLGLGRCYSYLPKRYPDALAVFARAAEVCPNQPEPYYRMGLTLLLAGERDMKPGQLDPYEEALDRFERALELGFVPRAKIYNAMGTASYRMGEYSDAVKWFRLSYDSLTCEGGWQPSTFFLAAEAYERLGDLGEAINWYKLYKEHGHLNDEREIDERIDQLTRSISSG